MPSRYRERARIPWWDNHLEYFRRTVTRRGVQPHRRVRKTVDRVADDGLNRPAGGGIGRNVGHGFSLGRQRSAVMLGGSTGIDQKKMLLLGETGDMRLSKNAQARRVSRGHLLRGMFSWFTT